MAKKKETKRVDVEQPKQNTTVELNNPMRYEKPGKDKIEPNWEIKDRYYYLAGNREPLAYVLKSSGLFWFDEEKGYEREIKYTRNQQTVFVDEFKGEAINEHIIFRDGVLSVPRRFQNLQKFLSLYHPAKGVVYLERDEVKEAINELDYIELEIEALNLANGLEIDMAEAIMRAEIGSRAGKMSSKELKRDLLLFARRNPSLFIELANDENVHLRNIGIKATESRIISLSQDQRTFTWGSTGRKLMTVPFDEHPYSALAAWFKTDEGMEVFSSIEKRLK